MTRQEWMAEADEHQRRMNEIDDPDDAIYQMHERRRDACWHNADYARERMS